MEVESIRYPPSGPSFRNQYLPGSRAVSAKTLYRANVYKNKGTHGIAKVTLTKHQKQRSINGYVMERGKNTFAFKLPKGFSTKQLIEISRTPRSGSIMRVVQQTTEDQTIQKDFNKTLPSATAAGSPQDDGVDVPSYDFARRRVGEPAEASDPMNVDSQPLTPQSTSFPPTIQQQVFEERFVDAQEFLQDFDDDIQRRLHNLQQDQPQEYREADGQMIVFDTLADEANNLRDPFMLDNQNFEAMPMPLPVTVDEIQKVAMKRRRSSAGAGSDRRKMFLQDTSPATPSPAEKSQQSPPLPPPPHRPQGPGPAQPVTGKRVRRKSSIGGEPKRFRQTDASTDYEIVKGPSIGQATQRVVKRKRQLSLSDQRHAQRKPRTDKGPKYTADRTVIAKAPPRVRRKSDEYTPAQSTRSKVNRKS